MGRMRLRVVMVGSPSVVVGDLDVLGSLGRPTEADAPLLVDPDGVLSRAVFRQRFEVVAGRGREVHEQRRHVEHLELAFGLGLEGSKLADALSAEEALGLFAVEGSDHSGALGTGRKDNTPSVVRQAYDGAIADRWEGRSAYLSRRARHLSPSARASSARPQRSQRRAFIGGGTSSRALSCVRGSRRTP